MLNLKYFLTNGCVEQIYGNGKQTRSFQYVSDLTDGLVALMESNYTQPVNIGNPVEHTIEGSLSFLNTFGANIILIFNFFIEFAVIIRDLVGGKTSKMETMPAVEDDPQRRRPDIARAKKYLNWEPRIPLKVGLEKTIEYFRKELDRSNHSHRNLYVPKRSSSEAKPVTQKANAESTDSVTPIAPNHEQN